jgi:hypothetical protein
MRKALLAALLIALAFSATGNAGTSTTLKGVVISKLPMQGELVLASAGGRTTTLRAPSLPPPGTVIRAATFTLSDGTSAAKSLHVVGHVRHTRFLGVLVRTVGTTSFFAAGHTVVAVHIASRSVASARAVSSDSPLALGEAAEIDVTIAAGGELDEDNVTPAPAEDTNQVTLQVTITAVTPATATTPGSITLTINGQTLVIALPAGTVLPPGFVPNATVGLTIAFNQTGQDQGEDGQGDDDNSGPTTSTTTTTTTTMAVIPSSMPTTAPTTTSGGHDGGGSDGGHDGGGGD